MKRPVAKANAASGATAHRGANILDSQKLPNQSFVLYESAAIQNLRVDGTVGLSLGPINSRIDFFTVRRVEANAGYQGQPLEHRDANISITIPTMALLEFLANAAAGLRGNEQLITAQMDGLSANFRDMVAKLGGATQ
jgi:hypothetical protein